MRTRLFALTVGLAVVAAVAIAEGPDLKEISLERTPCFGGCPVYKVTLKPDGTVVYEGRRFVEKIGRFEGKTNPEDVGKVLAVADKLGFWKLKDKYTILMTDQPSALVTIDCGAKKKTTDNYADQGPAELWAVEQLIDSVANGVKEWKKID